MMVVKNEGRRKNEVAQKRGKTLRESAGGHATQRRRVCDGVVRMKNEKKRMNDTFVYPPDAEEMRR